MIEYQQNVTIDWMYETMDTLILQNVRDCGSVQTDAYHLHLFNIFLILYEINRN